MLICSLKKKVSNCYFIDRARGLKKKEAKSLTYSEESYNINSIH